MIYFYMWTVFLVSIVLAVPIVAQVEKSRLKKVAGPMTSTGQANDPVAAFDDEPVEVAAEQSASEEFGEVGTASGEDFSAFDDFK